MGTSPRTDESLYFSGDVPVLGIQASYSEPHNLSFYLHSIWSTSPVLNGLFVGTSEGVF